MHCQKDRLAALLLGSGGTRSTFSAVTAPHKQQDRACSTA